MAARSYPKRKDRILDVIERERRDKRLNALSVLRRLFPLFGEKKKRHKSLSLIKVDIDLLGDSQMIIQAIIKQRNKQRQLSGILRLLTQSK